MCVLCIPTGNQSKRVLKVLGCVSRNKLMVEELEKMWSKLSLTEEEDEDIVLGSNYTKAGRAIGRNCVLMKAHTTRSVSLDALRKNVRMLWKTNK